MRTLAQILEWEDRLARNMVPAASLPTALHSILSGAVDRTVQTGVTLATGRVKREQIFPLVDMIATMHDPYVLPSMKKAFRAQTMAKLKDQFLGLLNQLCDACQNCVAAFSASVASEMGQVGKGDATALTTVAAQTAFAMRVLKVLLLDVHLLNCCVWLLGGLVRAANSRRCAVCNNCSTHNPCPDMSLCVYLRMLAISGPESI